MTTGYFQARYTYDPARSRVWRAICHYLQPRVSDRATVVDLGAGYCDFINQIAAGTRIAVDANPDVAQFCAKGVRFIQATGEPLDIAHASVDVVHASNLLEHLEPAPLETLVADIRRILKPSGTLILIQPNIHYAYRRYWDDYTHVRAFSHVSLGDFLAAHGFTIATVEKRFLPLTMKGPSVKSYWLTRAYLALPWRPFAGQMLIIATRA